MSARVTYGSSAPVPARCMISPTYSTLLPTETWPRLYGLRLLLMDLMDLMDLQENVVLLRASHEADTCTTPLAGCCPSRSPGTTTPPITSRPHASPTEMSGLDA